MHQRRCQIVLESPPDFLRKDQIAYIIPTHLLWIEPLIYQGISINHVHRIDRKVIYLAVALRWATRGYQNKELLMKSRWKLWQNLTTKFNRILERWMKKIFYSIKNLFRALRKFKDNKIWWNNKVAKNPLTLSKIREIKWGNFRRNSVWESLRNYTSMDKLKKLLLNSWVCK